MTRAADGPGEPPPFSVLRTDPKSLVYTFSLGLRDHLGAYWAQSRHAMKTVPFILLIPAGALAWAVFLPGTLPDPVLQPILITGSVMLLGHALLDPFLRGWSIYQSSPKDGETVTVALSPEGVAMETPTSSRHRVSWDGFSTLYEGGRVLALERGSSLLILPKRAMDDETQARARSLIAQNIR